LLQPLLLLLGFACSSCGSWWSLKLLLLLLLTGTNSSSSNSSEIDLQCCSQLLQQRNLPRLIQLPVTLSSIE
jgi:hypothetical protein